MSPFYRKLFLTLLFILPINYCQADRYVVLFVHGLGSDASTWTEALKYFGIKQDDIKNYVITAYPNGGTISLATNEIYNGSYYALNMQETIKGNVIENQNGNLFGYISEQIPKFDNISFSIQGSMVKVAIEYLLSKNNARMAILVGHSMGGLAIYSCIKKPANEFSNEFRFQKAEDKILQVFTIGTPFRGSELSTINDLDKGRIIIGNLLADPSSWAVKNLKPYSPELSSLDLDNVTYKNVYNYASIWYFQFPIIPIWIDSEILFLWRSIFNGQQSDGAVSLSSQWNNKIDVWNRNILNESTFHTQETSNIEFLQSIKYIIDRLFQIGNCINPNIHDAIADSYEQNWNLNRLTKFGLPRNNVHPWDNNKYPNQFWTQDFTGPREDKNDDDGVFMFNDLTQKAYWIDSKFFKKYVDLGGPGYFGAPKSNEYTWQDGLRQDFDRHSLSWTGSTGARELDTTPIPVVPVLLSPGNGFVNQSITPVLMWSATLNSNSYRVQISQRADFSTLIGDYSTTNTCYSISLGTLNYSTTYYWRVKSVGSSKESEWSAPWSFTTFASPISIQLTPTPTSTPTNTPKPIAKPTSGTIRVSIKPQEAVNEGAQWRLNIDPPGFWRNSGTITKNIPLGTYYAEFKELAGWITPPNKEITITIVQKDIWVDSEPYTLIRSSPTPTPLLQTPNDTRPPYLMIKSPKDGDTFSSSRITVSGEAGDMPPEYNGISSVTVNGKPAINGTAIGSILCNWELSIDLIPGPNTITVMTIDNSSYRNVTVKSITVNYDQDDVDITNKIDSKILDYFHENYASELESGVMSPKYKPIMQSFANKIISIIIYDKNISSLAGLEHFRNLQKLYLSFNQISDLTPLSSLVNLENLVLYKNNISDISALAGLTKIRFLSLGQNPLRDISALANLSNLESLELNGGTLVDDIKPLLANPGLGSGDKVDVGDSALGTDDYQDVMELINRGVNVSFNFPTPTPTPLPTNTPTATTRPTFTFTPVLVFIDTPTPTYTPTPIPFTDLSIERLYMIMDDGDNTFENDKEINNPQSNQYIRFAAKILNRGTLPIYSYQFEIYLEGNIFAGGNSATLMSPGASIIWISGSWSSNYGSTFTVEWKFTIDGDRYPENNTKKLQFIIYGPTVTPTFTPTNTPTPNPSHSPLPTDTPTLVGTQTPLIIETPTVTITPIPTFTPTPIPSFTQTNTPTITLTITPTPTSWVLLNQVYITDNLNSKADLSTSIDQDRDNDRCLVICWNFNYLDINNYHVYVNIDWELDKNGKLKQYYLGQPQYPTDTWLEWRPNKSKIALNFKKGPQFGKRYHFWVYPIREGHKAENPKFYPPIENKGIVWFMKE